MNRSVKYLGFLFGALASFACFSQTRSIDNELYHLRTSDQIEWKDFTGIPLKKLQLSFTANKNQDEHTFGLAQEDVKQKWNVQLNGSTLGTLQEDENSMVSYFAIPPGFLREGKNELTISQADLTPDDIRVGEFILSNTPLSEFFKKASVEVSVTLRNSNLLIPARITIVNVNQRLQPVSISPDPMVAVRAGCIYTGTGKTSFQLPAGTYTIYASRGFQYGVDSTMITLRDGDHIIRNLKLEKELPLEGWISCDPHVHTLTYSGHGDATMNERILTLAGEGIEFPVITEHNRVIDIDSLTRKMNLRQYFTPVAGDEYTTAVGHFNVFPLNPDSTVPDHKVDNWNTIPNHLGKGKSDRVIILNHGRDIHHNFRPYDPKRHWSIAGKELDGWKFPANSMEVINSGAQQFDILQLYRDWFGMMNAGHLLTPVGSSDSHDVFRYMVGQGRTYIRYIGSDPSNIDKAVAIRNFLAGDVAVSFGLIAELKVSGIIKPSSIPQASRQAMVSLKVLGPSWTEADSVFLFANGQLIRTGKIKARRARGVKWQADWPIQITDQDVFLVVIATGPDPKKPFWSVPNPYQPTSTAWRPRIAGSSGAVWIDSDSDGKNSAANDYAVMILSRTNSDIRAIIKELGHYDEAVSVQAAVLLKDQGILPASNDLKKLLIHAAPAVKKGFASYNRAN